VPFWHPVASLCYSSYAGLPAFRGRPRSAFHPLDEIGRSTVCGAERRGRAVLGAMRHAELRLGNLAIEGRSVAGAETWVRVRPPGLAFDTGRGASQLSGVRDIFLSHGHLDHALGLPYVLSQRTLQHHASTRVFCPVETAEPLAALIAAAERLERAAYLFQIVPLAVGERVDLGRDLRIEAFATDHVVPSLGYHMVWRKRRLAGGLAGLAAEELAQLRQRGVETTEEFEEVGLSYCGDTGPGVFELSPEIFESRVLMLECTFMGDSHRVKGDRYKHLHLGDIVEHADRFHNTALVLHHLSRRFRPPDLLAEISRRIPQLAPRIHLLVEEEP
jgi:ribonuclease Z